MILRQALTLLALPICLHLGSSASAQELDSLKDATDRWIQTRNRISQEKSQWITDREMLRGSIEILSSTQKNLSDNVEILEMQSRQTNEKISDAESQVSQFELTNTKIKEQISVYEQRILDLSKRLPDPLLDEISPLLRKIPQPGSDSAPLPNRLQNVVAISTLIDEFNNDLTLDHTIKELDDSSIIEVRVLYWGLAGAYASNTDGSKAWLLSPSDEGWKWTLASNDSVAIKTLFDVYDKSIDPTLASIPFSFSNEGGAQ